MGAGGGMSRAAKGADCKSAGYAFVGSSPTSPTTSLDHPSSLGFDVRVFSKAAMRERNLMSLLRLRADTRNSGTS